MITTSSLHFLGMVLGLASLAVRSHVIPSRQHEHHTQGVCSQVTSILESFQQTTVCSDYPAVEDEFLQQTLEILITKKCYNNQKSDESCLQETYDKLMVKDRPVFCGGFNKITSMIQVVKMMLCALEGGDGSDREGKGLGFDSFLTNLKNIMLPTTTAADSSSIAGGSTTAYGATTSAATIAVAATVAAATTASTIATGTRKAILISGGMDDWNSAQAFFPSQPHITTTSCLLPRVVLSMRKHTQDGLLACGGVRYPGSCEEFQPATGTWAQTAHTLQHWRKAHVSWSLGAEGTQLMGGRWSGTTTEMVKQDGTTEPSFNLKYDTWFACSIPDPSSATVMVTGGEYTQTTVSRYGRTGWLEDLPSLTVGRRQHACGSYMSGGVSVLLVTGGEDTANIRLSSTELLVPGSGSWRLVAGQLPRPIADMKLATVDNVLYLTGGLYNNNPSDQILQFNADTEEWSLVGRLMKATAGHAVSTVNWDDVKDWYWCGA